MKFLFTFIKNHRTSLIFLSILFLAILLRIPFLFSREFWYDEAFTGIIIHESYTKILELTQSDVHPPLYYILLKLWAQVWGTNDIALRSFSLVVNIFNIIFIFIFLKKYKVEKNLTYSLSVLLAINPFFINYAAEARMYSLLSLFYFLALYFYFQALHQTKKFFPWIFFVLFYTLSLYTHYISILAFIPFFILVFFNKNIFDNLLKACMSFLVIFLLYTPWLTSFFSQYYRNDQGFLWWIPKTNMENILTTPIFFLFGSKMGVAGLSKFPDYYGFQFNKTIIIIFFIIEIILIFLWILRVKKNTLLSIFFIFSYGAIFFIYIFSRMKDFHIYLERYLIIFLPFFVLFLFSLLFIIATKKIFYSIIIGYVALLLLIKIPKSSFPYHNFVETLYKTGRTPQEVVVSDAHEFVLLRYYLPYNFIKNIKIYNISNPNYDYTNWVVISNEHRIFTLPTLGENVLIISPDRKFLADNFQDQRIICQDSLCYVWL